MIAAMVLIFTQYPESTLKEICSPLTGMPTLSEFLPGIFRFKAFCNKIAEEVKEHQKRVEFAAKGPLMPGNPTADVSPAYRGSMEDIRPGDVLSADRVQEYREFMMKKKGVIVPTKIWAENEMRDDLGIRPFQLSAKPETGVKPMESLGSPNPFEI